MKVVLCLLALTAIARSDTSTARKHNTEGMKLYAKHRNREALAAFDAALVDDPAFVLAHYNAASMASLLGDNPRVIKELEWLAVAKDPAAAKALAAGKNDNDLARATMHARVRELLGLPPLDKLAIGDVLLAYDHTWGCDSSSYAATLTFAKNGSFVVEAEWSFANGHDEKRYTGTWKVTGDQLELTAKGPRDREGNPSLYPFGGTVNAHWGACEGADAGTCLVTTDPRWAMFHRGAGTVLE